MRAAQGSRRSYQTSPSRPRSMVASNLFLGRERRKPGNRRFAFRALDTSGMRREAREQVHKLGISTLQDVTVAVENLSGGQRQAVAVARAAAFGSKVVILDEPTAALGVRESNQVLELIGRLESRAFRSSSSAQQAHVFRSPTGSTSSGWQAGCDDHAAVAFHDGCRRHHDRRRNGLSRPFRRPAPRAPGDATPPIDERRERPPCHPPHPSPCTRSSPPGREPPDDVERLILDYAETVRAEPGNVVFDVYRRVEEPDRFFVFEIYGIARFRGASRRRSRESLQCRPVRPDPGACERSEFFEARGMSPVAVPDQRVTVVGRRHRHRLPPGTARWRRRGPEEARANVAITLAGSGTRRGCFTRFAGDDRGQRIRNWLDESGVDVVASPAARTSTARARLDTAGSADYEFDIDWSLDGVAQAARGNPPHRIDRRVSGAGVRGRPSSDPRRARGIADLLRPESGRPSSVRRIGSSAHRGIRRPGGRREGQ